MAAVVLVLLAALLPTVASATDDPVDWDTAPPSQIHQRLWESKVRAQTDREFFRGLASAEGASTQANYDVRFYDIFIRVNDTTEIIYGRVKFVADAAQPSVSAVEVDFAANMTVDSIVAPSGPLTYSRSGDVVTVNLDSTYRVGEEFTFDFYYSGHPLEGGFQAFAFGAVYSRPLITTLSEPYFARTWWPCKDRMDDKADSFYAAIEVDTSFYCGSNGVIDSTVSGGGNTHTFYYSMRYPMATYLFSLAIYPYTVWYDDFVYNGGADTMPVVHAVYPELLSYSQGKFAVTPYALGAFSDIFGLYPFITEKYGHALFQWGGAMEHQTMSSMTGDSYGMSEPVVVHEMSHQWWGDMITCESWQDIWLNEGWASYAEALFYEYRDGAAAYRSYMVGMDYPYGGTIYCQDTTSVGGIFTSRVYDKGAWALHMLRGVLGDSIFFAGVDAYYNSQYKWKAATTDDFKNLYEAVSGQDLDWFFDEWIHGTYRPNYQWYMTSEPATGGGYDVYLRVKQIQTTYPQVFKMPLDIRFTGPGDTIRFMVDEQNERLKTHFDVGVSGAQMDPQQWVLLYQGRLSWQMFIVTMRDELSDGEQFEPYVDTVRAIGGSSNRAWSIAGGTFPAGLSINNVGVISGTPTDTGQFNFLVKVVDNGVAAVDSVDFDLYIAPNPGLPGDVDNSGDVNVSDLTDLTAYLFQGGPAPLILNSADVDASCDISIADVTYLVAYLFQGGPAPLAGCVN